MRPNPIAVLAVEEVDESFHARFSATGRAYRYLIQTRRAHLTFDRGLVWRTPFDLDVHAMQEAAQYLLGEHDFTTFRDAACQAKSPVKTLDTLFMSKKKGKATVSVTLGGEALTTSANTVEFKAGSIDPTTSKVVCQSNEEGPIVAGSILTCSVVANDDQGNPTGDPYESTSVDVALSGSKELDMDASFGSKGAFPTSVMVTAGAFAVEGDIEGAEDSSSSRRTSPLMQRHPTATVLQCLGTI